MALAAPFALVGLLALPAILWLHRRRRRPAPVDVPSLLFLDEEDAASLAPERVRFDAELWVALAAAALLALAAAGPVRTPEPGRTVRVVLRDTPSLDAPGADGRTGRARAADAVAALRRALGPADRLVEQAVAGGLSDALAAARGGAAGLRVVVADRVPADAPADVRFVAVGDPAAANVALLSAAVVEDGGARRAFAVVRNDAPSPYAGRLAIEGAGGAPSTPVRLGAHETRGFPVPLPGPLAPGATLVLVPGGGLAADDRAVLAPRPLRVGFEAAPAERWPAHREAVDLALRAAEPGWTLDATSPDLWVGTAASAPSSAGVALVLHPVAAGEEGVRPDGGAMAPIDPAWGKDLDLAGADLVYDPDVARGAPPFPVAAARAVGERTEVHWFPDPVRGQPPLAEHPSWPLFVENVVARVVAALPGRGPAPDPDATLLGRDVAAFSPAWLAAAPTDRVARPRSLRAPLAVGGGLCLLWLWLSPLLARRRA